MGNEKESLPSFLRSKLNIDITSKDNKVMVYSENLSSKELEKLVNKFVYRRNLMKKYWVTLEKDVVKINKFERLENHERRKKRGTPPSIIKHGW